MLFNNLSNEEKIGFLKHIQSLGHSPGCQNYYIKVDCRDCCFPDHCGTIPKRLERAKLAEELLYKLQPKEVKEI